MFNIINQFIEAVSVIFSMFVGGSILVAGYNIAVKYYRDHEYDDDKSKGLLVIGGITLVVLIIAVSLVSAFFNSLMLA